MQMPRRVNLPLDKPTGRKGQSLTLPREVEELPMGLRRAASWSWRFMVVIGALWLIFKGLGMVSTLFISVLVAILLASMLQPFVKLLTKHTFLPRMASAAIALVGLIVVVVGMFVLAGRQLVDSWGAISKAAVSGFTQLWNDITGYFKIDVDSLGNLGQIQKEPSSSFKSTPRVLSRGPRVLRAPSATSARACSCASLPCSSSLPMAGIFGVGSSALFRHTPVP